LGGIDWIGVLLALAILFWIPTHIMTFSIRFLDDYRRAGIPTFPAVYGIQCTRLVIALSSLAAAFCIGFALVGIGMAWGYLRLLAVLSAGLLLLAARSLARPSERINLGLFKYASLYMLSSMLLLILNAL
jgi:protoheme IX farnesyltransferase